MYGEHIYLLDRMWSVCVMSKTDSMLNVIHSNVKREREREREKQRFIQKDFQMVHWCYLCDVVRSTVVALCYKLWYVLEGIDRKNNDLYPHYHVTLYILYWMGIWL